MLGSGDLVRDARVSAGLSQAALADAAGISRQAIGAIETGAHRPGIDAALAISRVTGRPVEELFADPPARAHPISGHPLPDRSAILAARVGDRVVYAGASDALAYVGWPQANAILDDGRARPLPDTDLDGLVVLGCDPALGLAAALLPARGPRRLIALSGSTGAALEAMREGRAHGAVVHDRTGRLPTPPPGTLRVHLARWRVGLASRGRRPRSMAELCRRRTRVVQREPGASSQKALLAAAAAEGAGVPDGPIASGHLDVARRVAAGAGAGVTMEPAALQFGLAFNALEEHVVELWVDARWRAHSGVDAVGAALRSPTFATRLSLVGGYEATRTGSEEASP